MSISSISGETKAHTDSNIQLLMEQR